MDVAPSFTCQRCGHTAKRKGDMVKHLQRKMECPPVYAHDSPRVLIDALFCKSARTIACLDCGKAFKSDSSLRGHRLYYCRSRHSETCLAAQQEGEPKYAKDDSNDDDGSGSGGASYTDLQSQLRHLAKQVEMLSQSSSTATASTTNHITQTVVTNNINNNITINGFGKETIDHITTQFLDQCVRRTDKGLVELIEKIHFHPAHQENCNIRITNVKLPIMQVHDGMTWKYDRKDRVLSELVGKGHGMMQEHLDDHEGRIRDQVSETMFDHIRRWMDKMQDRDKKTLEGVLVDMYILILNTGPD